MRPLRLEMSGFSAFAEPTVVDFADVELAAFVGPTGSGKSSVIDAMTFALYGAAARYDQRAVAPVINQLAAEAKVRFDFELAGTSYTAVRVVRRTKNGATTKEARLEAGDEVLAGDEKALTAAVVGLLGLDFDKFNKTVVLPQGRFAEFLHDKPSDRQELLRGLLGVGIYDRIGRAARERAVAGQERRRAAGRAARRGRRRVRRAPRRARRSGRGDRGRARRGRRDRRRDRRARSPDGGGRRAGRRVVVRRDALARVAVPTGVGGVRRGVAGCVEASRGRGGRARGEPKPARRGCRGGRGRSVAEPAMRCCSPPTTRWPAAAGGSGGRRRRVWPAPRTRMPPPSSRRARAPATSRGGRGGRRRRAGQRRCCRGAANRRRPRRGAPAARRPRPARRPGRRAGWSCRTGGRRRGGASRGRQRVSRSAARLPRPSGSPRRRRWPSTSSSASRARCASRWSTRCRYRTATPRRTSRPPVPPSAPPPRMPRPRAGGHRRRGSQAWRWAHGSSSSTSSWPVEPDFAALEQLAASAGGTGRQPPSRSAPRRTRRRRALASTGGDDLLDAETPATTELATARAMRDRASTSVEQAAAAVAGRLDRAAADHALARPRRLAARRDDAEGASAPAPLQLRPRPTPRWPTSAGASNRLDGTYDELRERLSALAAAGLPAPAGPPGRRLASAGRVGRRGGTPRSTAQIEAAEAEQRRAGGVRRGPARRARRRARGRAGRAGRRAGRRP